MVGTLKAYGGLFLAKCSALGVTLRTVAVEMLVEPKTVANGKGPQKQHPFFKFCATLAPYTHPQALTSVRKVFKDIIKVTNKR